MFLQLLLVALLQSKLCESVTVRLNGSAEYALSGKTFRFTCTVSEDKTQPTGNLTQLGTVTFSKDSYSSLCQIIVENCSQDGMVSGYSCGCLSGQKDVYYMNISRVSDQNDSGIWRCERSSVFSNNINLPVYYPAKINTFTINSNNNRVTVNQSDHVTMRCEVEGNQTLSIKLLNGTKELTSTKTSLTAEHRWTADCRQRGNYSCLATYPADSTGSDTKNIKLLVKCSPRLDSSVSTKKEYMVKEGSDITLSVTFLAYPTPSITWTKKNNTNNRNLTSISSVSRVSDISVTASLTLTGVQQQDFGEYFVQADNGVGKVTTYNISLVSGDETTTTETDHGTTSKQVTHSTTLIIGVSVGVGAVVLLIILITAICCYRKRTKQGDKEHISKQAAKDKKREVRSNVYASPNALPAREKAVMCDNVVYESSGDTRDSGEAVFQDNFLYGRK